MSKDSFEIDRELNFLAKEMEPKFQKIPSSPVRTDFQGNLRYTLSQKAEEESAMNDVKNQSPKDKKSPFWKSFLILKSYKPSFSLDPLKAFFYKKEKENRLNMGVKLAVSFGMVVVMFTGLFWGLSKVDLFVKPVQAGELAIKALDEDSLGVARDTAFLLSCENVLDEKTVKETLRAQPAFSFQVEKESGGKAYRIIPTEKLAVNTVYKLSFDLGGQGRESSSWAFQTRGPFRVVRTLPGDKTSYVPVNTGIEFTFSHENYNLDQIKEYFSISPSVEGRFEKHKKTLVFVSQGLKPGTLYTVTLKKGLPLEGTGEILGSDYSFNFETIPPENSRGKFTFELDTRLTQFTSEETPVFPAYFNARDKALPVLISLYKYKEHRDFQKSLLKRDELPAWASYLRNQYREDLSGQSIVGEYETEFIQTDEYSHYLQFPSKLEPGYYAAEIKAEDYVRQIWFQVTDLAAYIAQGQENSLIWINNLTTKGPVPNPQIERTGKELKYQTNENGVIFIEEDTVSILGQGVENDYILVKGGSQEVLVPLRNVGGNNQGDKITSRDYWKYLYLDRELYKPGDVVNFWGVVSPRGKESQGADSITVELRGSGGYYYEKSQDAPILREEVVLDGNTFTGRLQLPLLKPDYYYLQVKMGDISLLSRGFSVETYQKPAYQLSITPEKKAIFAGEGMNFKVQASFFEGTPVPGVSLKYHIEGKQGVVETDSRGAARIPYIGKVNDSFYSPRSYYVGVSSNLPEVGEISTSSNIYVFAGQVHIKGDVTREGKNFNLQVKLSDIDLTRVNEGEYPVEENFVTGPVANSLVKGTIFQDVWEKVETGERYDFISKEVVKTFYYKHSTQEVADFSLITDGDGIGTYSGTLDEENSYFLEISAQDNEGRVIKEKIPVPGSRKVNQYDFTYQYLKPEKEGQKYAPGASVKLAFMQNENPINPQEKGVLYFYGREGIESYHIAGSNQYAFRFEESFIPNVNVYGVYFDGTSYHETSPYLVPFASETRELKVAIETDKGEYRPGEQVKLKVSVRDQEGKPVTARVNLNLVDEALYSLRQQETNLINSLYADYLHPLISTWKSHYHPQQHFGAEQGGEGESERKDFRDTVLFTTLQTDEEGRAQTEFSLPDNLTSWRVTYHAMTPELEAASGTSQIQVRLPFFVEMVINDTCLKGDMPTVILRSFGEKLDSQSTVSYSMKLVSPAGKDIVKSGQSSAFSTYDWKLPALEEEGRYTLTVKGSGSGMEDVLTREITVVDSFLERTTTNHEQLKETTKINTNGIEPMTLIFSDYEKNQFITGLYQLSWLNGSRLEQQLARKEAQKLLSQYFPGEKAYFGPDNNTIFLKYQQYDGGISILPYSESEPALSALAAYYHEIYFDSRALAGYFHSILDDEKREEDDKILALRGLASLGEPVLLQIKSYLAEENIEPAVKINLALAALEIGDGSYAQKIYQELISQYGEDLGAVMPIKVGQDQDEIVEATTQMALLAARLDQPEKQKLYQYLLENRGQDILNLVEQVEILKYNLLYMDEKPVSFTYELKGEKTVKTLQGRETFQLSLLTEDVPTLKFSDVKGKVGVMAISTQPYRRADITPYEGLQINRVYTVKDREVSTLERSDLVKVVINYNIGNKAPGSSYEIVDVLPAGLHYISRPYLRHGNIRNIWWPTEINGQKLVFSVSKGSGSISYYARVVSPGEFLAEPPLLSHVKNNKVTSIGSQGRVVIK